MNKSKIKIYYLGKFGIVRTKKDIKKISMQVEKAALKAILNDNTC